MPNNMGETTVDELHQSIQKDIAAGKKPVMDDHAAKAATLATAAVKKQKGKFN